MKKPKIKFDKQQVMEFLLAHVEKGVFGLFILGFLMFCVGAMKHSPYDKVPKDFMDAATRVDSKVTASTFDPAADVPPMQPLPEAHAVPEAEWATLQKWSSPAFDMKKRRPEPKFLALLMCALRLVTERCTCAAAEMRRRRARRIASRSGRATTRRGRWWWSTQRGHACIRGKSRGRARGGRQSP